MQYELTLDVLVALEVQALLEWEIVVDLARRRKPQLVIYRMEFSPVSILVLCTTVIRGQMKQSFSIRVDILREKIHRKRIEDIFQDVLRKFDQKKLE